MQHDEAISQLKSWANRWKHWAGPDGDERRYKNMAEVAELGAIAIADRDQLRAELAAAKDRGDGLYLGLRQTLEALGGVAQPGVSEAFLILGVPGEAAAIKRLNNTLAADNARLREALGRSITALVFADTPESKAFHFGDLVVQLREALAATPAQSLEAVTAPLKANVERLQKALEEERTRLEYDKKHRSHKDYVEVSVDELNERIEAISSALFSTKEGA